MLSSNVHFPLLCLCKRKSNLSLSFVGCLWLLSMIARTVSDSLSNKTDLGTSVFKQQLGNVTPKYFLLDSDSFYSMYKSSATEKVESAITKVVTLPTTQTSFSFNTHVKTTTENNETTSIIEQSMISKSPSFLGSKEKIFTTKSQMHSSLYHGDFKSDIIPNDVITNSLPKTSFDTVSKTHYLPLFHEESYVTSSPISAFLSKMSDRTNSENSKLTVPKSEIFIREQSSINIGSSYKFVTPIFNDKSSEVSSTNSGTQKSFLNDMSSSILSTMTVNDNLNMFDRQVMTSQQDMSSLKETYEKSIKYNMNSDAYLAKQSVSATNAFYKDRASDDLSTFISPYHLDSSTIVPSSKGTRTKEFISSSAKLSNLRPISTGTIITSGQHDISKPNQIHRLSGVYYLQSSITDQMDTQLHTFYTLSQDDSVAHIDGPYVSEAPTDFLKNIPTYTSSLSLDILPSAEIVASKTISEDVITDVTSTLVSTNSIVYRSKMDFITMSFLSSERFRLKDFRFKPQSIPILPVKHYNSNSEDVIPTNIKDASTISKDFSVMKISTVSVLPKETSVTALHKFPPTVNLISQSMIFSSLKNQKSFSKINLVSNKISGSMVAEKSDYDTKILAYTYSDILAKHMPDISELLFTAISVTPSSFSVIQTPHAFDTTSSDSEFKMSYLEKSTVSSSKPLLLNIRTSMNQKHLTTILPTAINENQRGTSYGLLKITRETPSEQFSTIVIVQASNTDVLSSLVTLEETEHLSSSITINSYKTDILPTSTKLISLASEYVIPDRYSLQTGLKSSQQGDFEYFSGSVSTNTFVHSQLANIQARLEDSIDTNIISLTPSLSLGSKEQISEQDISQSSELIETSFTFSEITTLEHDKFISNILFETELTDINTKEQDSSRMSSKSLNKEYTFSFPDILTTYIDGKPTSFSSAFEPKSSKKDYMSLFSTSITANGIDIIKSSAKPNSNLRHYQSFSSLYMYISTETDKFSSPVTVSKHAERRDERTYKSHTGKMMLKRVSNISPTSSELLKSEGVSVLSSITETSSFSNALNKIIVLKPSVDESSIPSVHTYVNFLSPSFTGLKIPSQNHKTVSLETIWTYTDEFSSTSKSISKLRSSRTPLSSVQNAYHSSAVKNDVLSSFIVESLKISVINNTHTSVTDEMPISNVVDININEISSYEELYSIASSSFMNETQSSSSNIMSSSSMIVNEDLAVTDINEISSPSIINNTEFSSDINKTLSSSKIRESLSSPVKNAVTLSSWMKEFTTSKFQMISSSSNTKESFIFSGITKLPTSPITKGFSLFSDTSSRPKSSGFSEYPIVQDTGIIFKSFLSVRFSSSITSTTDKIISKHSAFSRLHDSDISDKPVISRKKAVSEYSSKTHLNGDSSSSMFGIYSALNTTATQPFSSMVGLPLYSDLDTYPSSLYHSVLPTYIGKEEFMSDSSDVTASLEYDITSIPGIYISPTLSSTYKLSLSVSISEDSLFSSLLESSSAYANIPPTVINALTSISGLELSPSNDALEIVSTLNIGVSPLTQRKDPFSTNNDEILFYTSDIYDVAPPSVNQLISISTIKMSPTSSSVYMVPSYSDKVVFLSTQRENMFPSSTIQDQTSPSSYLESPSSSPSSLMMEESLSSDTAIFTTSIESSMFTQFLYSEIQNEFRYQTNPTHVVTNAHVSSSFSEVDYQIKSSVLTSKTPNNSLFPSDVVETSIRTKFEIPQNASVSSVVDNNINKQSSKQHFTLGYLNKIHKDFELVSYSSTQLSMSQYNLNSTKLKKLITSSESTYIGKEEFMSDSSDVTASLEYDITSIPGIYISPTLSSTYKSSLSVSISEDSLYLSLPESSSAFNNVPPTFINALTSISGLELSPSNDAFEIVSTLNIDVSPLTQRKDPFSIINDEMLFYTSDIYDVAPHSVNQPISLSTLKVSPTSSSVYMVPSYSDKVVFLSTQRENMFPSSTIQDQTSPSSYESPSSSPSSLMMEESLSSDTAIFTTSIESSMFTQFLYSEIQNEFRYQANPTHVVTNAHVSSSFSEVDYQIKSSVLTSKTPNISLFPSDVVETSIRTKFEIPQNASVSSVVDNNINKQSSKQHLTLGYLNKIHKDFELVSYSSTQLSMSQYNLNSTKLKKPITSSELTSIDKDVIEPTFSIYYDTKETTQVSIFGSEPNYVNSTVMESVLPNTSLSSDSQDSEMFAANNIIPSESLNVLVSPQHLTSKNELKKQRTVETGDIDMSGTLKTIPTKSQVLYSSMRLRDIHVNKLTNSEMNLATNQPNMNNVQIISSGESTLTDVKTKGLRPSKQHQMSNTSNYSPPLTTNSIIVYQSFVVQYQTIENPADAMLTINPTPTSSLILHETVSDFPNIAGSSSEMTPTDYNENESSLSSPVTDIETVSEFSFRLKTSDYSAFESKVFSKLKTISFSFSKSKLIDTIASTGSSFIKNSFSKRPNVSRFPTSFKEIRDANSMSTKYLASSFILNEPETYMGEKETESLKSARYSSLKYDSELVFKSKETSAESSSASVLLLTGETSIIPSTPELFVEDIMSETYSYFSENKPETHLVSPFIEASTSYSIPDKSKDPVIQRSTSLSTTETGYLNSFDVREIHDSDSIFPVETSTTWKLPSKLKVTENPSLEKLTSSYLTYAELTSSNELLYSSSEFKANTLDIVLSSIYPPTSSIDRMLVQNRSFKIEQEVVTSTPVEIISPHYVNSLNAINGASQTPFISDANEISEDAVIISETSYAISVTSNSVTVSSLYLQDTSNTPTSSQPFSETSSSEVSSQFFLGPLKSRIQSSLLLASVSTALKPSVSILEVEALGVTIQRSEFFKLLDAAKSSLSTTVETSIPSQITANTFSMASKNEWTSISSQITANTFSMASKNEWTKKSDLPVLDTSNEIPYSISSNSSVIKTQSSLVKLQSSPTLIRETTSSPLETTNSFYSPSLLSTKIKASSSGDILLKTQTPSLKSSKENIDMPSFTDQVAIISSHTIGINSNDQSQTSKQSITPSSRTFPSKKSFQKTTPLSSLKYRSSDIVQSEFALSSFESEYLFFSAASTENLLLSSSTSYESTVKPSSTSLFVSSSPAIDTSTSQLPSPRDIDKNVLLTIGIIMKTSVNINKQEVHVIIKQGLERCYIEGVIKADNEDGTRNKRAYTNIAAEVFHIKRKELAPSHVDVDFYILVNGLIQFPADVVVIFSRLTIAETSAYLSFPVTTPVKSFSGPKVQTPTNKDESNISMVTVALIAAPTVCALMAIVLCITFYCRKGDNTFRKNWSTLHDADLKVDIEKGEVVSATVSRNKDFPQFSFDNGKEFGSIWTPFKPPHQRSKQLSKKEKSFKRPLKEMSSISQRLERLRNQGFHVSEIRKPDTKRSREVAFDLTAGKEQESFSGSCSGIQADIINDLDKPTDQVSVQCSDVPIYDYITQRDSNDFSRESRIGFNGVIFQPAVVDSNASTAEYSPNIKPTHKDPHVSKNNDSLLYGSTDSLSESDQFLDSKHSKKSKEVSSNRRKKKLKRRKKNKNVHLSNMKNPQLRNHLFESVQNTSPNSRPRVPSIPVEGYCNKIMYEPFYTSLTLSKDPLPVNNFIEGDLEDDVFLTDSFPFQGQHKKCDQTMKLKNIPVSQGIACNLATSCPKRNQMKNKLKCSKSVTKRDGISNNKCDIVRKPFEVNSAQNTDSARFKEDKVNGASKSDYSGFQSSLLQSYLTSWSDDTFYSNLRCGNLPDGSEYAGHEFESLNFNPDCTNKIQGRDLNFEQYFPASTTHSSKMTDVVVTESFPGMCEHVTKMGRVGKNHKGFNYGRSAGPQFRKLPFQDQTIQMVQVPIPGPSSTPRRGSPVIVREIPRLPFLPHYPTRAIMKDTGMQTVDAKNAEVIYKNRIGLDAKYKSEKGSLARGEEQKYKSKWVEVVNQKGWMRQDFDTEGSIKRNDHYDVDTPNRKEETSVMRQTGYRSKKDSDGIDDEDYFGNSDKNPKNFNDPVAEEEMKQKKNKEKWVDIVRKKDWKNQSDGDYGKIHKDKRNSQNEKEHPDEKEDKGKGRKKAPEAKRNAYDTDQSIDEGEVGFENPDNIEKMDKELQTKHKSYKSKWASVIRKKDKRDRANEDLKNVYETKRSMDDTLDDEEISRAEYSTGKKTIDEMESDVDDETNKDMSEGGYERGKPEFDTEILKGNASRKNHRIGKKITSIDKSAFEEKNRINTVGRPTDDFSENEKDQDIQKDEEITSEDHEEVSDTEHDTGKKTGIDRNTDQDGEDREDIPAYNHKRKTRTKRGHSKKDQEVSPQQKNRPTVDSTPYVEMKLGRNMRAAPKGSLAAMSLPDANTQLDASVPLLHNHTLQSNDIADYFANTHNALRPQTQGSGIASRQYPSRSITSPQHPSQDLIETLNRNNLTSLITTTQETHLTQDKPRKVTESRERIEQSLKSLQEEGRQKQEEAEKMRDRQRKFEAEEKLSEAGQKYSGEEQKLSFDFETKNTLLTNTSELTEQKTVVLSMMGDSALIGVATPPPPVDLYSSYRRSESYEQKSLEQASTQPFSPQDSTYFSRGETTTTTTTSLKEDNSGVTAPKSFAFKKQETAEEVEYDIEEIESLIEENEEIKEDDFDF